MKTKRKTPGVVVLGIDGLDPRICRMMMEAGELPALSQLAERGGFSPLVTSVPPQSPVAWSSTATSTNPGEHGLFDFLDRNTENYLIELGILKTNPRNILGTGSSMMNDAPDLVLGFHPGFRASWQSAVGGAPGGPLCARNLKKWTGDHLVDPAAVTASLFTSFSLTKDRPTTIDIGSTALALLGIEIPEICEGEPAA